MKKTFIIALAAACAMGASAQVSPTVDEIAPYVFPLNSAQAPPNFIYAPDGNGYLMLSADKRTIDRYDTRTGQKTETLFDASHTRETTIPDIEGFSISDNGRWIVVYRDKEMIYRRTFKARYYVYEVRTRLLYPLSERFEKQQSPVISSDGRQVAFMAENNIYIRKNDYKSEVAVTTDGALNSIINGVPDWVYEEEFDTRCSMVWSPDCLTLAYIKYNETDVPMYTLPIYMGSCDPRTQYAYYPGTYSYKYPVAGKPNSVVSVHTYDVETRKTKDITFTDRNIEYIPRIDFGGNSDRLMVCTLNRDQNRFELYSVNPRSTTVRSVYTDTSRAWIDSNVYTDLQFAEDYFVVMSEKSGFNHCYQYSYAGAPMRTITSGDFDVKAFYGADERGNFYYQAAAPTCMDRTVCMVDPRGTVRTISAATGTTDADFAPDMSVAMFRYSDPVTPPVYTMNRADGREIRSLIDNRSLLEGLPPLPAKEFFTMESDGVTLNGYIIRGRGENTPVVMYQYSGPGSQEVLHRWSLDWQYYFALKGYTVVCVDGRGTGGRGTAFKHIVYKQLGKYETIDQLNAARYAAALPYTDSRRVAIFGWSYGGYEALMCAEAQGNPYAACIAVAPVTDWRYYDTVYSERFMLTPQQNEDGYRASAPISRVSALSCPTLLMYGTSDDNVHPMNTLQYVSQLQNVGGLCDMFVFPNMNHSIYGCNARSVVYAKMFEYLKRTMK